VYDRPFLRSIFRFITQPH